MPEHANPKLREIPPPPGPADAPRCAYAELDVVTNFSFLRGASHPDELVHRATALGYRALAIADVNSLAGVVRAHAAARQVKEEGGTPPKLIIGARLTFADFPDLLVYATDRAAYARLCRLLTLGKRRADKGECALNLEDFLAHQEGLLAAISLPLTQPLESLPDRRSQIADLRSVLNDRLWLAAAVLHTDDDATRLARLDQLARSTRVPLLATNHVHYHDPSRRALQDVLACVRHGCAIQQAGFRLFPNAERHLKAPDAMTRLFVDYPEAIAQALEVADRCTFSLDELRYEYPHEVVPPGLTAIEYLARLTWEGAAQRYPAGGVACEGRDAEQPAAGPSGASRTDCGGAIANPPASNIPPQVRAQILHELDLIEKLNYAPYFLTVYDIVRFARSRGILCQGRGSAANSAVCYCIGVTSVDPARIDVLFERFVSAARNEPPDIDVDFEHERREEVIQYVYEKYGRERAGMTAVVITYRGRSAVRDVGKAMGLSLDLVDQMAKRLDWWHRGSLNDQHLRELGLDPDDPTIRTVIALSTQLLGFPRHLSQHVGGLVITRGPLCELVPIENAAMANRTVIEWDKDDIDTMGMLKVDCLALGMLTCLSKAMAMINQAEYSSHSSPAARLDGEGLVQSRPLELYCIPPEDPRVYDMICSADTVGVFQVESRAQMSMLPRLRPRKFYDLVIEVAIVRPGPIQGNMVHPYLRRRNGEEPVSYPSEALRKVLEKTLGVPLFQEQAMKIAMVGAGFSADEADRLRRAMAAWRKSGAIDGFHHKIVDGMLANGYTREFAEQCFLQIRGFGEYGFPESHAASFALLVYASAWIKRYHPAAFCAAILNSLPMGFYAPAQLVRDAREHAVDVRPADVNQSQWECTLEHAADFRAAGGVVPLKAGRPADSPEGRAVGSTKPSWGQGGPAVRLGLRMIKGLREADARHLTQTRERMGSFANIADFHRQTRLRKPVLRRLAEADAFASLGLTRRQALWHVMELDDAQYPLFNDALVCPPHAPFSTGRFDASTLPPLPPMPIGQEVMTDYFTTSLSLKRHPVSLVRAELDAMGILPASGLQDVAHGKWVKVAGVVLIRQRPGTASGIVFETLEDETGIANLIVRPNIYDRFRKAARHAALLHAEGYLERQGQVTHIMAYRLFDLSPLLEGHRFTSRDFH